MQSIAAVLRCYNNKLVTAQVQNLLSVGVGLVIVVVNAAADKGATVGWLSDFASDPRVKIIEMHEGYTWSSALNIALMAIKMENMARAQAGLSLFDFIFNVSVEAGFTAEQLQQMLDTAHQDSTIGVVGTSFQGLKEGVEISLGKTYRYPRNTGMLIRLEVFGTVGCFDPQCDAIGGMEDVHFCLGMLAQSELRITMLDLKVGLVVGVNYDQAAKEAREMDAMNKIIALWRGFFPLGTMERNRIEGAIARMGLEK